MTWTTQYYEAHDGTQPAEVFENALERTHPKLLGKLLRAVDVVNVSGPLAGGGLLERCRQHPGVWELRTIFSGLLAREFLGFDGQDAVLLHGYTKRVGEAASQSDLSKASKYCQDYLKTRKVSPEEPDDAEEEVKP